MDKQDGYKLTTAYAEQALFPGRVALWRFKNRGQEPLGVLAPALRQVFGVKGEGALMHPVGAIDFGGMSACWPMIRAMGISHEFVAGLSNADHMMLRKGGDISIEDAIQILQQLVDSGELQAEEAETVAQMLMGGACTQMQIADDEGDLVVVAAGNSIPTSLREIPVLARVSDLWTRYNYKPSEIDELRAEGMARLKAKIDRYNSIPDGVCKFGDMGTRRALTFEHGVAVTYKLACTLRHYAGTSNVGLAAELDVPCLRTMPHQWLQMGQALCPDLGSTQEFMLRHWADVYNGTTTPLIALTDCLGIEAFLREFKPYLARMYHGVRHDSGDPIEWGNKILTHYEDLGIDPRTKIAVFSDSLNPEQVFRILDAFAGKFKMIVFGIGTDFTNDCGIKALQIVMKLVRYANQPVAKLADGGGGKNMCDDPEYVIRLKKANGIP